MIDKFTGRYRFLSNFFTCHIVIDGVKYRTVEHYYQCMKTLDEKQRKEINNCIYPGDVKRLGQKVRLRNDWEQIKVRVMMKGLKAKFSKLELRKMLLKTGKEKLIEGNNWHDNYWGNCKCTGCRGIHGKNVLGKLLMLLRNKYKENKL